MPKFSRKMPRPPRKRIAKKSDDKKSTEDEKKKKKKRRLPKTLKECFEVAKWTGKTMAIFWVFRFCKFFKIFKYMRYTFKIISQASHLASENAFRWAIMKNRRPLFYGTSPPPPFFMALPIFCRIVYFFEISVRRRRFHRFVRLLFGHSAGADQQQQWREKQREKKEAKGTDEKRRAQNCDGCPRIWVHSMVNVLRH